jgi:hypothetical protein
MDGYDAGLRSQTRDLAQASGRIVLPGPAMGTTGSWLWACHQGNVIQVEMFSWQVDTGVCSYRKSGLELKLWKLSLHINDKP